MKRSTIVLLAVLGVIVIFVLWGIGQYNSIFGLNQSVEGQWGEVQNQYQRRADLVPNLVNTVKGFAAQEQTVLLGVTEARASVGKMTVTKEILENPALFNKFQAAQDQLSSALQRLLVVSENYPQLKSNENFLSLQSQLEGTENRIAVARGRFNQQVQEYNTARGRFPGVLIANIAGFREKPYFQAKEGSDTPPAVKF
ncbi:MAG: LemA family protein [Ignavibacteriae bacterium]|nr:LemA family protein [Ignavibacteriota bacterium]